MRSDNLWNKAKEHLSSLIENISESNSTITVVAFQDKIYQEIRFKAADKVNELPNVITALDKIINTYRGYTSICRAWDRGVEIVKENQDKFNYLFLITDGKDNINPETSAKILNENGTPERLLSRLRNFCAIKNNTTVSFFVSLTKEADLGANVHDCIKKIDSDYWENMVSITPLNLIISSDDFRNNQRVSQTLYLSKPKSGKVSIESSDTFFNISLHNNEFINGEATLNIINTQPLPYINGKYVTSLKVKSQDEKQLRITTEQIQTIITVAPERTLNINTPPTIKLGEVKYYPAFLWSDAKIISKLDTELPLTFNKAAYINLSEVEFYLENENKDFDIYYNDKLAKNGKITIDASDTDINNNLKISILFHPDAKTGKRTLQITAKTTSLDRINNEEPNNYKLAFNVKYAKGWNPLKTILFWILVAIIAIFVILIVIIRANNPTFKIRKLQVEYYSADGELHYANIPLKGYYEVICSDKKQKQSLFARLFKGKIAYEVNGFWDKKICLKPKSTSKNTIQIIKNPYDALIKTINKGEVTEFSNNNNEKVIFNF
jgi:hypothetical protein